MTGVAIYGVMSSQIKASLAKGLEAALQSEARLFETQIEEALASTRAVTTRPFLIRALKKINAQPSNTSAMYDIKRNIDSLPLAGFMAAAVYDIRGKELTQVGHFSGDQVPLLPLRVRQDSFLVWHEGQFVLRDSVDILDQDGRRIGSITVERHLLQLTRSFREIRTIGKTGEFLLCKPLEVGGEEIACFISQASGMMFKLLPRRIDGKELPISYVLDGKIGVITAKDYRQVLVVAAHAPLVAYGLGMVLKLDEEELYAPIIEQIKIIALYLAGLVFTGILLLYWLVLPLVRKLVRSEQLHYSNRPSGDDLHHRL